MYMIQFVGLICFTVDGNGKQRALAPDGRFPDEGIQPHLTSLSVRSSDVVSMDGWRDGEVSSDPFETEFFFPPSVIALPFSHQGAYSESERCADIPQLSQIDPSFQIGPDANWIANIPIDNGALETFRIPGLPDPASTPLLGQMTVAYDDDIEIVVTARKGWPVRRISLNAGSEIAIINTSRGLAPRNLQADHFQIYGELSSAPVTLLAPQRDYSGQPLSPSRHPTFRQPRPATFSNDCVVGRS